MNRCIRVSIPPRLEVRGGERGASRRDRGMVEGSDDDQVDLRVLGFQGEVEADGEFHAAWLQHLYERDEVVFEEYKEDEQVLLLTQLAACLFHRNEEIWAPRWHKVGKATRTAFHLYTTILKT